MKTIEEKSQAEPKPQAAKRPSIYDDPAVKKARDLVDRMQAEVAKCESEFAAATERGTVNEIDALLTGQQPAGGADEALHKLHVSREALSLATKCLDTVAIRASGQLVKSEEPRHAKIGMEIFQNLLDLKSSLDTETAFINELRDRGVMTTIPPLSLGGEANDILRRLARFNIGLFARLLESRFGNLR